MDLTWCLIFAVVSVLDTTAVTGQAFDLPSPENVTVNCDNFDTFVYWNYSKHQTDHHFQVKLMNDVSGVSVVFESRDHHANITGRLNNTKFQKYTIQILARNRTHTSDFSSAVHFTFHDILGKEGVILCKMDFPVVKLEYRYGVLALSFQNPIRLYENSPALKYLKTNTYPHLNDISLVYDVMDKDNNTTEFKCPYKTPVCQEELYISEKDGRHCVRLSGKIDHAVMRPADRCSEVKDTGLPLHSVVVIVSVLSTIAAAVVCVALACWKIIIKPNHKLPPSLNVNPNQKPERRESGSRTEAYDKFTHVTCDDAKLHSAEPILPKEPSETSEDPLLSDYASDICTENSSSACSRFAIGPGHVCHDEVGGARREYHDREDPYLARSKSETPDPDPDLDPDPSLIIVEMAPGETADGYTFRERLA
ncbi:hypothetical protein ACEWY4_017636 [Coilia grayii]|uniref:Fibronectin type-III domain-containing protein n=1 Tax=Coilia grayii TaxID=363190 RepID=A0ABD1JHR0_9TELE